MPFCEAVKLFEYWADSPPTHLLVKAYLNYKGSDKPSPDAQHVNKGNDALAMRESMRVMTGRTHSSGKIDKAPPRDQERFAALKKQFEESQNGR